MPLLRDGIVTRSPEQSETAMVALPLSNNSGLLTPNPTPPAEQRLPLKRNATTSKTDTAREGDKSVATGKTTTIARIHGDPAAPWFPSDPNDPSDLNPPLRWLPHA